MSNAELNQGLEVLKDNLEISSISASINLIDYRLTSLSTRIEENSISNIRAMRGKLHNPEESKEKPFAINQVKKSSNLDFGKGSPAICIAQEPAGRKEFSGANKIQNVAQKENEDSEEEKITPAAKLNVKKEEKGTISQLLEGVDMSVSNVNDPAHQNLGKRQNEDKKRQGDRMNLADGINDSFNA